MNNTTELWTRGQLDKEIARIELLLNDPCFRRDATFDDATQSNFINLIFLEDALLRQAERAGKRIDFMDEVGTNGRIEDITSLITIMSRHIYEFNKKDGGGGTLSDGKIISPHINHFYGAGVGYFPNGLFFSCIHEDDLAFFVGSSRIFFSRHLVRAFEEAKSYLQSVILLNRA
ncbi:hypothetical protein [Arsenicibacter rosenii]|uniref:Uncharacterized protein n=1 Tax=Arsenicibacter rosenii TaxID=1750698 RepID=A0A1S2VFB4_9BACT|nr:hypothetical protein [Arsenicibacter rosenii]OIN57402.1 hypothetical protein BLX24_19400 [Arsenicibacter rosenii]